jgi:hypothetical protein
MRLHLNGFDNDDSERLVCLTVVVAVLVDHPGTHAAALVALAARRLAETLSLRLDPDQTQDCAAA